MKRPNRDFEIFSLSALDLFASSMGAFIILVLIMFPSYQKKDKVEQQVEILSKEAVKAQVTASQAKAARDEESNKLKERESKLARDAVELDAMRKERRTLETKLDRSVDFALLGLATKANSFVIVIDMSGSMTAYADIMVDTVLRIIDPLNDKNRFSVLGYRGTASDSFHPWPATRAAVQASGAQKAAAESFVRSLKTKFDGSTPTLEALQQAIDYDVDAIILLSDGAPDSSPTAAVAEITRRNAGRKEIHSVAIGNYTEDSALIIFLQDLARKNKGNFVGISR